VLEALLGEGGALSPFGACAQARGALHTTAGHEAGMPSLCLALAAPGQIRPRTHDVAAALVLRALRLTPRLTSPSDWPYGAVDTFIREIWSDFANRFPAIQPDPPPDT
jgi:hypothetical protein